MTCFASIVRPWRLVDPKLPSSLLPVKRRRDRRAGSRSSPDDELVIERTPAPPWPASICDRGSCRASGVRLRLIDDWSLPYTRGGSGAGKRAQDRFQGLPSGTLTASVLHISGRLHINRQRVCTKTLMLYESARSIVPDCNTAELRVPQWRHGSRFEVS